MVKSWEIWIMKIWINIWSEVSKDDNFTRPVLILSNFLWWDLVWIIPFTTKYNKNYDKFLYEFKNYKKYWLNFKSYLLLNQFKTVSIKRLERKINNKPYKWNNIPLLDIEEMNLIKEVFFNKILK
jgi:mRNA-degrading endonuclease toxin of MazEF toxin-antitoxin module